MPSTRKTATSPLTRFIEEFGDGLLDAVQSQNPAVYSGRSDPCRESVMEGLLRRPFPAQREVVQAVTRLLVDENQPAAVINAEMGTGKTMMAIAAAAVMHGEGYTRTLVIAPPHLVYKWRREIRETVPEARVLILNGPHTFRKLLQLRAMQRPPSVPEFFVMGRVCHIRRACAGRESSSMYHRAKFFQFASLATGAMVYLMWPVSIRPVWIVLPLALLTGVLARVQWTYLKKYL